MWQVRFKLHQTPACRQQVKPNGEKFVPIGTEHNHPHLHLLSPVEVFLQG